MEQDNQDYKENQDSKENIDHINTNNSNNNDAKRKIWGILSVLFAIGALVCIGILIKMSIDQKNRAEDMSNLVKSTEYSSVIDGEPISSEPTEESKTSVETETQSEETQTVEEPLDPFEESIRFLTESGIPIPELEVDIAALQESTNPDIYAWIYIPDTKVNYPVLQHQTDDSYYLNYNIDGTKGYPGCIYSEKKYNSKDFSDSNTVLYGHNMKNGTMFGSIHKYEDRQFFEEHPYIYVYTPERLLVYHVFAAYEHGNEHLLYNHNFSDSESFRWYFEDVMTERSMTSNFLEDIELTGEEKIITLSTCINNKPTKRYLVQGVLLNEE